MKNLKQKLKERQGITLVALIITVIILLILAGVTIASLSNSGLFQKSTNAVEQYKQKSNEENTTVNEYENWLDNYTGGSTTGGDATGETLSPGDTAQSTTKNNYEDKKGAKATIPAGYAVSTETGTTEGKTDETTVENGLVIKKDGNEWVWIPVADVTAMYDEAADEGWTMLGTSVKSKKK